MSSTGPQLRRDAARNRSRILEVAAEVFAASGLDASYDEIARRAGVGVGTVYRRFPERAELIQALFESRIEEIVAVADEALARDSAWDGLCWFLERVLERQVADRGLKEVMVLTVSEDQHQAVGRERIGPRVEELVDRAHAEGTLRTDAGASDLGVQLLLISSVSTSAEPDLWRRYLALVLESLRARPGQAPLPGAPPAEECLEELMRRR